MGWYDAAKDALKLAQQLDNIELIQKIIEIQQDVIKISEENTEYKEVIKQLKDNSVIDELLERIEGKTYYILPSDGKKRFICSTCWDVRKEIVQIYLKANGTYICMNCDNNGIYDNEKYNRSKIVRFR